MSESTVVGLERVYGQLREATRCARKGSVEIAQVHIASAIALLQSSVSDARSGEPAAPDATHYRGPGALAPWRARKAADYIEANLYGSIRMDVLAAAVGLSNSHFCRAFRLRFGVSPHFYINCRRIELSRRLMLTTRAPLSEIALLCGMSDQAHFTRVFRRIVGEAPNRWRQSQPPAYESSPRCVDWAVIEPGLRQLKGR